MELMNRTKPASHSMTIWSLVLAFLTLAIATIARKHGYDVDQDLVAAIVTAGLGGGVLGRFKAKTRLGSPGDPCDGEGYEYLDEQLGDPGNPYDNGSAYDRDQTGMTKQRSLVAPSSLFEEDYTKLPVPSRVMQLGLCSILLSLMGGCAAQQVTAAKQAMWQGSATIRAEHLRWAEFGTAPLSPGDLALRRQAHQELEDFAFDKPTTQPTAP